MEKNNYNQSDENQSKGNQSIKCTECGEIISSSFSLSLKMKFEEHKKQHQRDRC